jgi:hypothetical protein
MDQGAACPVCYQPPYFCLEVRDNTTHFSIKIVEDDFEDGVVSCYIFFQSFFKFFYYLSLIVTFVINNHFLLFASLFCRLCFVNSVEEY